MQYISVTDAHDKIQKKELVVLDIREAYEYEICSIEAIQIPMAEVTFRIDEVPSNIEVAVMCRSGKRADALANLLVTEYDRSNISVLEGGILAWIEKFDTHLETY